MATRKPRVAISYDFDGTLAPGNMQEHQFLPDIGMRTNDFWSEVRETAKEHHADEILIYMSLMLKKAGAAEVPVRRSDFEARGRSINLFPGVVTWFERVNAYAKEKSVIPEHYIISSGNAELIAGTPINKYFKKIYASSYQFDQNGVAAWPALAVNYTNKTQFLFRVNKGALEIHDKKGVNKFTPEEDRPVPFSNMIFIGDGETDIPCFRLVKDKGGLSLAVYKPNTPASKKVADELLELGRVHSSAPADYSPDHKLEKIVKAKIDEIAARFELQKNLK